MCRYTYHICCCFQGTHHWQPGADPMFPQFQNKHRDRQLVKVNPICFNLVMVNLSLSSMGKVSHRGFFFSSGRSVSEGSLYPPRVVFTHERSEGCNWDPRGVKMPEDTLLSEEKKKSKVVSFFTWRMWLSSILEVIPTSSECLILKQPLQPQTASNSLKTASKQPQKYFFA